MVLFLAKSAVCIGLVAAAASGVGVDGLAAAVGRGVRTAVEEAGPSCLQSEACLRAGAGALAAAAAAAPAPDAARPPRSARGLRPAGA